MLLPQSGDFFAGTYSRMKASVAASAAALQQSAFAVMLTVPVVKVVEEFGRLLNGDDRPFGEDVELGVGDEGSDFEDVVALAVEAGHFEVNPDEVIGVLHG